MDSFVQISTNLPNPAGPSASPGSPDSNPAGADKFNEALFLIIISSCGFLLNSAVIACIISVRALRRTNSAFLLHSCTLNIIKCAYCVPFAASLLRDEPPASCAVLGGSFVLMVTASGFNIVAMICCEAYTFSESISQRQTFPTPQGPGRVRDLGWSLDTDETCSLSDSTTSDTTDQAGSSVCCILFGILMVYVGSLIIHLGPTIIGGNFDYNDLIGNCIFVYGSVKSYVAQTMWIIIMTLAIMSAMYLLCSFYKHLKLGGGDFAGDCKRPMLPIGAQISPEMSSYANRKLNKAIRYSMGRTRVFGLLTIIFVICWYPLYVLTLVDLNFQLPTKVYKLLTFLACSSSSLDPLVLILFDSSITKRLCCKYRCTRRRRRPCEGPTVQRLLEGQPRQSPGQCQQVNPVIENSQIAPSAQRQRYIAPLNDERPLNSRERILDMRYEESQIYNQQHHHQFGHDLQHYQHSSADREFHRTPQAQQSFSTEHKKDPLSRRSSKRSSGRRESLMSWLGLTKSDWTQLKRVDSMYQRVGNRLCNTAPPVSSGEHVQY